MANLKEIRDRIVSVKNTRKITEAMRLVAAAKVRRAQDQVLKSRPFAAATNLMASVIFRVFLTETIRSLISLRFAMIFP